MIGCAGAGSPDSRSLTSAPKMALALFRAHVTPPALHPMRALPATVSQQRRAATPGDRLYRRPRWDLPDDRGSLLPGLALSRAVRPEGVGGLPEDRRRAACAGIPAPAARCAGRRARPPRPPWWPSDRRIEDDRNRDGRIVDRREASERRDVLGVRIRVRCRIDLLRGAGLSSRAVALKNRFLARAVKHHALHHLLHLGCGERRNHLPAFSRVESDHLRGALRRGGSRHNARGNPRPVIRNGRNHGSELQRRDADFLPHGDGADRDLRPAAQRFGQTARLSGKFDARLLPETVSADVFVEPLIAQAQRDFDGAHVARLRQNVGDGQHAEGLPVVNAAAIDDDGTHLAIERLHPAGSDSLPVPRKS